MDYREQRSNARGVYPTQYTSRREQQGWNRHKNNSLRVVWNMEETNLGTKGKSSKQGLTNEKYLPMAPEGIIHVILIPFTFRDFKHLYLQYINLPMYLYLEYYYYI